MTRMRVDIELFDGLNIKTDDLDHIIGPCHQSYSARQPSAEGLLVRFF
jgi:hypothetical protein